MAPPGMPPQMMAAMAAMPPHMMAMMMSRMASQMPGVGGMPPPPGQPPMHGLPDRAAADRAAAEEEEKLRQKEWADKIEADKAELQRRKAEFKQLLLEKNVTPGGTWEKELPKFCFDKRTEELLPLASDRKAVFQTLSRADLVKFNATKKERMAAKREKALVVVKELLATAKLSATSTVTDFWASVSGDERLEGLDEKDKKLLQAFNLRVEPLRAAAREEENKAREEFLELLKADPTLNSETSTCGRFVLRLEKAGKSHIVQALTDEMREKLFNDHMKLVRGFSNAEKALSDNRGRDKDREREKERGEERDKDGRKRKSEGGADSHWGAGGGGGVAGDYLSHRHEKDKEGDKGDRQGRRESGGKRYDEDYYNFCKEISIISIKKYPYNFSRKCLTRNICNFYNRYDEDYSRSGPGSKDAKKQNRDPYGDEGRHEDLKKHESKESKKRREAEEMFDSMLRELITHQHLRHEWKESRSILRKDERYEDCAEVLSSDDRERRWEKHIEALESAMVPPPALPSSPSLSFLFCFLNPKPQTRNPKRWIQVCAELKP